jgi:hypothetical protein
MTLLRRAVARANERPASLRAIADAVIAGEDLAAEYEFDAPC